MAIELPALPYSLDALEPHISKETLEYHYGKHHRAYVDKLNELIINSDYATSSLEEIITTSSGKIFNNAAQVWNHTFYWHCLAPTGGSVPVGPLADALVEQFGSFEQFQDQFTATAIGTFGSGWAWLVKSSDGLEIVSTSNANNPLTINKKALLTCDVWEHAYYVDYRNARPKYIEAFWSLVNWDFVAEQYQS